MIFGNSIFMMCDDPTTKVVNPVFFVADQIFLSFYSLEMILKIIGLGLFMKEYSYLRDPWNILDLIIVVSAYIPLFTATSSIN